jgi:hypothetical protein
MLIGASVAFRLTAFASDAKLNGKICLPAQALQELVDQKVPFPVSFKISARSGDVQGLGVSEGRNSDEKSVFCGVLDFSAAR